MRFRALASLVFASAVTTVAACSSVPDVTFSDDGGSSSGGFDAGPDVFIDPNCKKTGPEVCDDGIDNDCNGLTDCADPACTAGFTCSDPPPSGWSLVAFAASAPPACPTGYGAPTDLKVVQGDGSGGSCACTCAGTGGAVAKCADGFYTLGTGTGNCNTPNAGFISATGACQAIMTPIDLATGAFASVTAPIGPTTCAKNVTKTLAPINDGRQCAAPPKVGKGCPGTKVCVPKPTGMQVCAMKAGVDACPAPFSTQRRGGTSATDNRGCNDGSCNCTAAVPCSGTLTLFSNANCMGGNSSAINSGAACAAPPGGDFGMNGKARGYQATITGGCAAPVGFNPAVSGTIDFANPETVCCKQ